MYVLVSEYLYEFLLEWNFGYQYLQLLDRKKNMNFSIEQPTIQSYHLWNLNLTTLDLSPLLDVSNVA